MGSENAPIVCILAVLQYMTSVCQYVVCQFVFSIVAPRYKLEKCLAIIESAVDKVTSL